MNQSFDVNSLQDLDKIVLSLESLLSHRTLFLLVGEVGAGKTTLVGRLCQHLGMAEVASPSFAIHHRYENSRGQSLDHVDLYRLESEDDLESTGFWDLFQQESGWVVVEWADRLEESVWPVYWDVYWVNFENLGGDQRRIQIRKA